MARLKEAAGAEFSWASPVELAGGGERLIALGKRQVNLPA